MTEFEKLKDIALRAQEGRRHISDDPTIREGFMVLVWLAEASSMRDKALKQLEGTQRQLRKLGDTGLETEAEREVMASLTVIATQQGKAFLMYENMVQQWRGRLGL